MNRDHHHHFTDKYHYMNKYRFMKHRNPYRRYIAGAFFMVIGLVLLLNNFHLLPFELPAYVFTWKILLIVIGTYMLANLKIFPAAILIGVGFYFLIPDISGVEANTLKMLWPVLLILAGLGIVIKGFGRNRCGKKNSYVKNGRFTLYDQHRYFWK